MLLRFDIRHIENSRSIRDHQIPKTKCFLSIYLSSWPFISWFSITFSFPHFQFVSRCVREKCLIFLFLRNFSLFLLPFYLMGSILFANKEYILYTYITVCVCSVHSISLENDRNLFWIFDKMGSLEKKKEEKHFLELNKKRRLTILIA